MNIVISMMIVSRRCNNCACFCFFWVLWTFKVNHPWVYNSWKDNLLILMILQSKIVSIFILFGFIHIFKFKFVIKNEHIFYCYTINNIIVVKYMQDMAAYTVAQYRFFMHIKFQRFILRLLSFIGFLDVCVCWV